MTHRWPLIILAFLLQPLEASGQAAVQLPTFNSFSVNTSVLVPDRGSVFLGGVQRSYESRAQRGVPGLNKLTGPAPTLGDRRLANGRSVSYGSVSAKIIDFKEWEPPVENLGRMQATSRLAEGAMQYGSAWATATQQFQAQQRNAQRLRQIRQQHSAPR